MDTHSSIKIIILIVLVIISGFFSASETAYSSLNRVRLKMRAEEGNKRNAKLALKLIDKYDNLLSSILIGNNIVNIAAASIGTVLFTDILGSKGPTVSAIVLTVVILIFGEISPKSLAKEAPESFAMFAAPIINAIIIILTPVNVIFSLWKKMLQKVFGVKNSDIITEDELISMVDEAHEDGTLNENESELITSAIEFDDVEVESILTPRVDMESVPDTIEPDELYKTFEESSFSRIPVYHETVDNIIGMILDKDFYPAYIQGNADIQKLIAPVEYTTEKTKISQLLRQLQASQNHLSVVVDEFGGTAGIVTMEDILEELVGEIWDEHDDAFNECRKQSDGTYIVDASMSIEDFQEYFDIEFETDTNSVGGWVLSEIGKIPREGFSFLAGRFKIDIVQVKNRRIMKLRVRVIPTPKEQEEE